MNGKQMGQEGSENYDKEYRVGEMQEEKVYTSNILHEDYRW